MCLFKQKLMLSCSFKYDQICNSHYYEALLCYLSQTYMFNNPTLRDIMVIPELGFLNKSSCLAAALSVVIMKLCCAHTRLQVVPELGFMSKSCSFVCDQITILIVIIVLPRSILEVQKTHRRFQNGKTRGGFVEQKLMLG